MKASSSASISASGLGSFGAGFTTLDSACFGIPNELNELNEPLELLNEPFGLLGLLQRLILQTSVYSVLLANLPKCSQTPQSMLSRFSILASTGQCSTKNGQPSSWQNPILSSKYRSAKPLPFEYDTLRTLSEHFPQVTFTNLIKIAFSFRKTRLNYR